MPSGDDPDQRSVSSPAPTADDPAERLLRLTETGRMAAEAAHLLALAEGAFTPDEMPDRVWRRMN